jgi:hypothetical protein
VDVLQFVLDAFSLLLDLLAFDEDFVQLAFQFLVVIFDVLVGILDVFGAGVRAEFVQGEVEVGELPLELADFVIQFFESSFQLVVELLLLANLLGFDLEFGRLLLDALNRPAFTIIFSFILVT